MSEAAITLILLGFVLVLGYLVVATLVFVMELDHHRTMAELDPNFVHPHHPIVVALSLGLVKK